MSSDIDGVTTEITNIEGDFTISYIMDLDVADITVLKENGLLDLCTNIDKKTYIYLAESTGNMINESFECKTISIE